MALTSPLKHAKSSGLPRHAGTKYNSAGYVETGEDEFRRNEDKWVICYPKFTMSSNKCKNVRFGVNINIVVETITEDKERFSIIVAHKIRAPRNPLSNHLDTWATHSIYLISVDDHEREWIELWLLVGNKTKRETIFPKSEQTVISIFSDQFKIITSW